MLLCETLYLPIWFCIRVTLTFLLRRNIPECGLYLSPRHTLGLCSKGVIKSIAFYVISKTVWGTWNWWQPIRQIFVRLVPGGGSVGEFIIHILKTGTNGVSYTSPVWGVEVSWEIGVNPVQVFTRLIGHEFCMNLVSKFSKNTLQWRKTRQKRSIGIALICNERFRVMSKWHQVEMDLRRGKRWWRLLSPCGWMHNIFVCFKCFWL